MRVSFCVPKMSLDATLDAIAVIDAFVEVSEGLEAKRALACVNRACAEHLRAHFAQRVLTVHTGDCTRNNGKFVRRVYLKRRDLVLRTLETQENTNARLEEYVHLEECSDNACSESLATSSFFVGYVKNVRPPHSRFVSLSSYEGQLTMCDWSRMAGTYNSVAEVELQCAKKSWSEHVARRGCDEAWFVIDLSNTALHVSTGEWLVKKISNPEIKLLSLEVTGAVPLRIATESLDLVERGIYGVLTALTTVGVCVPSLRRLDLSNSNLTKGAVDRLSDAFTRGAFPSLDTIILRNTGEWNAPNTMTKFAKALQNLRHLHTLNLSLNKMSDTVLRRFIHNYNYQRLRILSLRGNATLTEAVLIDFLNHFKNVAQPCNLKNIIMPSIHDAESRQRTYTLYKILNSFDSINVVTTLFEGPDRSHTYDRSLYEKHRLVKADKLMLDASL